MAVEETAVEMMQYRLAIVRPDSRKLLTVDAIGGCRLPIVSIRSLARPAEQLQKAMRHAWSLNALILDFLPSSPGTSRCAVAELLDSDPGSELREATLEQVLISELSEQQRIQIASFLAGNVNSPFARIGWIDEAVAWVESATQKTLSSKAHIEQYNAGGHFSLVRFHTKDDRHYWMKATGKPNTHELSVASLLARLCPDYLPEVVATRPAWNAWLMREEAVRFTEMPSES
jgi:hypothetical protein